MNSVLISELENLIDFIKANIIANDLELALHQLKELKDKIQSLDH
jgi:hypothetical protein